MVRNTQLTVAVTQVRGSNTIPAGNIPQGLNTEVANNQLAENSTVYNQPPTSKVQPAVNATGFTPQTTNTWCNQMRNDMVVIHCSQNSIAGSRQELSNIPPYSQADGGIQPEHPSSNKESVESNSVFNQPSTNSMTTIQPATNTIAIRQPVDNNTGEISGGSNTTGKMSGDRRKSRSRLCGGSIDDGGNDDAEPMAKKVRLEPTPDEDSHTNYQGSWQGKY